MITRLSPNLDDYQVCCPHSMNEKKHSNSWIRKYPNYQIRTITLLDCLLIKYLPFYIAKEIKALVQSVFISSYLGKFSSLRPTLWHKIIHLTTHYQQNIAWYGYNYHIAETVNMYACLFTLRKEIFTQIQLFT